MLMIWLACTGADVEDSVDPCADGGCTEAPSAPEIEVQPEDPTTTDDLLCAILTESVDPDGTAVTYAYSWTYNSQATEITGDTVPSAETTMSQLWECTVIATDGDGESAEPVTDGQPIENSAPTMPEVMITPEAPTTEDLLECVVTLESTDADGHPIDYEFIWSDGAGNELDNGLQDHRFISDNTSEGQTIMCQASGFDGRAYSEPGTATVVIAPAR
jgi:hypothetical protein